MVLDPIPYITDFDFLPQEEVEEIPPPSIHLDGGGIGGGNGRVGGGDDGNYGRFIIEPLETGEGHSLANPLRRVLYSKLEGAAVTSVKIEGVQHEYQSIPNIKEQVTEILLNIKALRLRTEVDMPGKLRLDVGGLGKVTAADIMLSADYEIVNPELLIATLENESAKFSLELNVERGKGYQEAQLSEGMPIGVLPVDAVFTPIRKVSYAVRPARVGRRTDFERLELEIWTDGSISPSEAIKDAANILVNRFFLFANFQKGAPDGAEGDSASATQIPPELYSYLIERLQLSSRTLNCLKRAGIDTAGAVLEMDREALLQIRNFGEKSYTELFDKLRANGMLPLGLDPALQNGASDGENEP